MNDLYPDVIKIKDYPSKYKTAEFTKVQNFNVGRITCCKAFVRTCRPRCKL